MTVKDRIRQLVIESSDEGQANACEIWKGYGDLGQAPYGWWLKPFNEQARSIGQSWDEVKERW